MITICKNCFQPFKTNRKRIKHCSHICFLQSPKNTLEKCGNNNVSKRPEVRKKMSDARKGKIFGEKMANWKGDKVGYNALHNWVRRYRGKPFFCSLNKKHTSKRFEWANISHTYKRILADYFSLCVKCHKQYDILWRKKNT